MNCTSEKISQFDMIFEKLIGHEGRYSNRKSDPGNWTGGRIGSGELKGTKWGISAGAYPHLDIQNLSLDQAKEIYYEDYWLAAGCEVLAPGINYSKFDAAVNSGVSASNKFLQSAVQTLPDGIWGPQSQKAYEKAVELPEGYHIIIRDMNAYRVWHWMKLDRMDDEYGLGWARRGLDVYYSSMSHAREYDETRFSATRPF